MDVQLIDKEKRSAGRQSLDQVTNPGQPADPLGIIVAALGTGSFPRVIQLVQGAADRFAGEFVATLSLELKGQGGATPTGAAPAKNRGRLFDQGQERALPREQSPGFRPWRLSAPTGCPLAPVVSLERSIDTGARAKKKFGNLGRGAPRRTQQQDMQSQEVAVAGLAQLVQHLDLFFLGDVK